MLDKLYTLWLDFIALFPSSIRWIISLVIFIVLAKAIFNLVKKSFIWLLLLILFVPASVPLIKEIFIAIIEFLKFILPNFS